MKRTGMGLTREPSRRPDEPMPCLRVLRLPGRAWAKQSQTRLRPLLIHANINARGLVEEVKRKKAKARVGARVLGTQSQ